MSARSQDVRIEAVGVVPAGADVQSWMHVTLVCLAAEPRQVVLTLHGLDAGWVPRAAQTFVVAPGPARVQVAVHPAAGTRAGSYPAMLSAWSVDPDDPADPGVSVYADVVVEVGDVAPLTAVLEPAEPAAVRRARVSLVLGNRGDVPVAVTVEPSSHPDLTVRLRGSVVVPPQGSVRVRGRVTGHQRSVTGAVRRLPFVVQVQGMTTPLHVDGMLRQQPVLSRSTVRVAAFVALVALWAGIAVVGIQGLDRHLTSKARLSVTQQAGLTGGQVPSPSTSPSAGSGAGGGSGGPPVVPTAGALGQRVSGTVTGDQPDGVLVTLQSETLVGRLADTSDPTVSFVGGTAPTSSGKLNGSAVLAARTAPVPLAQSVVTGADGTWAFAGLAAPANYLVTLAKVGFQTRRYVVTTAQGGKPTVLAVPLTAAKGSLSGTVAMPASSLVGGQRPSVQITVSDGTTSASTYTPTSGTSATWSIGGVSTPGTYLVTAQTAGFGAQSQLVTLSPSGSQTDVDFGLSSSVGQLSGRVSTESTSSGLGATTPLGGATVTVTDGAVTRTVTSFTRAATNADLAGRFTIPGLPLGTYTLTVAAPGRTTSSQTVTVTSSTVLTDDVVLLPSTGQVCGKVLVPGSTTAAPAGGSAGPDIVGLVLAGDAGTFKTTSDTGTDAFEFSGIPAGSYVLTASAFGRDTRTLPVVLEAGSDLGCDGRTAPLSVELDVSATVFAVDSTSQIVGHAIDLNTGQPVACRGGTSGCVAVTDPLPDGTAPDGSAATGSTGPFSAVVDSGGDYRLPDLPQPLKDGQGLTPGVHHLTFSAVGYEPQAMDVTVGTDAVATASLVTLAPYAELTGTVVVGGGPIPAGSCVVAVAVLDGDDTTAAQVAGQAVCPTDPTATTDAGGHPVGSINSQTGAYDIPSMVHGSYEVEVVPGAQGDEFRRSPQPVFLALGQKQAQNFTLDRLGRYVATLKVADSSGNLATPTDSPRVTVTLHGGTGGGNPATLRGDCTVNGQIQVQTGPTFTACADGTLTLTGIDPDTYDVAIVLAAPGGIADVEPGQVVSLNQTTQGSFVLATNVGALAGQVVIRDAADGTTLIPVPGATVQVTAVIGYVNGQPQHEVFPAAGSTVTTDAQGCFALSTSSAPVACGGGTVTPYPVGGRLASSVVSLTVSGPPGDGYTPSTQQVDLGPAPVVEVAAPPVQVTGTVTVLPTVQPDQAVTLPSTAPNGSGNSGAPPVQASVNVQGVTLTVAGDGTVSWQQSDLPAGFARPGRYQLSVSGAGYTADLDDNGSLVVPTLARPSQVGVVRLGAPASAPTTPHVLATALATGPVTVFVQNADSPAAAVVGAQISLATDGGTALTTTSSGSGAVLASVTQPTSGHLTLVVRAAGYQPVTVTGLDQRAGGRQLTVVLQRALTVSGTVTGVTVVGPPRVTTRLGQLTVTAYGVRAVDGCGDPTATRSTTLATTRTADDGSYTLPPAGTTGGLVPIAPADAVCIGVARAPGYDYSSMSAAGPFTDSAARTVDITETARPVQVTLTVTSAQAGTTISDASITVNGPGGPYTATSGTAVALQPGAYTADVSRQGYGGKTTSFTVNPSDAAQALTIPLTQTSFTVPFAVTVTRGGAAVQTAPAGETVQLLLPSGAVAKDIAGADLTINSAPLQGSFSNVPDGNYVFRVTAPDYTEGPEPSTGQLSAGQTQPVRGTLTAVVSPVGLVVTPSVSTAAFLQTLSVAVTGPGCSPCTSTLTPNGSGSAGTASLRLESGSFTATVTSADGRIVFRQDALAVAPATGAATASSTTSLAVALPDTRVQATVPVTGTAPTGRTLTVEDDDATPLIPTPTTVDASSPVDLFLSVPAGGASTFAFTSAATSSSASYPYVGLRQVVALQPGTTQALTLGVTQVGDLSLTVTRNGTAVVGASVTARTANPTPNGVSYVPAVSAVTCAASGSGVYVCTGLLDGTAGVHVVTADGQTFDDPTTKTVHGGASTPATSALPYASLSVTLTRNGLPPETGSVSNVTVQYTDPGGSTARTVEASTTGTAGVYTFADLAPGTAYTVLVADADATDLTQTVAATTGAANGLTSVNLALKGARVALTVSETTAGATTTAGSVALRSIPVPATLIAATRDAAGVWQLTGVPPGQYDVVVDGVTTMETVNGAAGSTLAVAAGPRTTATVVATR